MNDRESSSRERLIAEERELRAKHTLHDALTHFPSYLRRFDNFFELLVSESSWRAPRLLAAYYGRLPMARVHVAFL